MKYKITKISIDKPAADLLIAKMAAKISKADYDRLEKMPLEFWTESDDGKIDIWYKVQFHSEFELTNDEMDGLGRTCINRTAKVDITMTESETGEEIGYDCPVALGEEIERIFYI